MPADESQPQLRQLPFESESSDQEVAAPAGSLAARVPRARAAALLAVAAAALVLMAVAGRSAAASTSARRGAVVSMEDIIEACTITGYGNLTRFGQAGPLMPYVADPGWIWLAKSDSVQVQGLHASVNGKTCLTEVTIGGPMLHGNIVRIAKDETIWYPASGPEQTILAGETSWSIPGVVEVSTRSVGADSPTHVVYAKYGDFEVEADQWSSASTTERCMDFELTKPLESGEMGLCVNADVAGDNVSNADNFAINNGPSPSGDTMDQVAGYTDSGSSASGSGSSTSGNESSASGNGSSTSGNGSVSFNESSASGTETASADSADASIASETVVADTAFQDGVNGNVNGSSDKSGTANTLLYFALSLGFANSIVPFVL
jgi:uncharacterized membrane protein YgcG